MYAIILALALWAKISFAANGLPCSGNVCASYYENISGRTVAELKTAAKFPDSPDSVMTLSSLDVPESTPNRDNYGVMVQAWVKAPQTGDYVFSTMSDDTSEVWVSPVAGEKRTEANMVKVVEIHDGCCQKKTGSTIVSLEQGKSYYLQAYMKEQFGNDYLRIGMTDSTNGVEYYPIAQEHLGFLVSTMYTKQTENEFCKTGNREVWHHNTDSLAGCQQKCNLDSTCVAMSWWATLSECMLSSVCDEYQISYDGAVVYFKVQGAVAVPGPPAADCTSGVSEFTQKMLVKTDAAQEKFGDCAADIRSISTTFNRLGKVSGVVEQATDTVADIIGKVNDISDKILNKPSDVPAGLGIADILGKVPKVGIFIKMGLKTIGKVIDGLEPLADTIAAQAERIDHAVKVTSKVFLSMKTASTPTSLYLTGSHKILEAAHSCGVATGYQCGTAAAEMESKNEDDYPAASERLEAITEVGVTCHNILSPIDLALEKLAEIAEAIKELFEPLMQLFRDVMAFIEDLDRKIEEFVQMLKDSEEAQCALEIFEPVTDTFNLLTCPIDEVAGFVSHYIIDNLIGSLNQAINTAVIFGVNRAVEGIVPDNLLIHIPDFTAVIPVDFWVDTCNVAAVAFPEYSTAVEAITNLPLPMTFTGRELKDSILTDPFAGMDLVALIAGYESACEEAWEEMGVDYENCEKVIKKIEDAVMDASCNVATAALAVEVDLLAAQQEVYNVAREHFEDMQAEFVKAQDELADVDKDLESAFDSVEAEKANCPRCRCGGCSFADINCHLEGVWCCPARHGCLAAMAIAQGGIEVAMGSVDHASDVAREAQKLYSEAATSLTAEQQKLKHQQRRAQLEAEAQALVCATTGTNTVAPITIDTAAPLPPCKCWDRWWSEECGVEVWHNGCPATACDNDPKGTWCPTDPGCAEEESTFDGGWFYCGAENLPPLGDPIRFPHPNEQCEFEITVTGEKYGEFRFVKEFSCSTTFTTGSEADNAQKGYTCGSRFGLKQGLLYTDSGETVGMLSCANQGFNVHYRYGVAGRRLEEVSKGPFVKDVPQRRLEMLSSRSERSQAVELKAPIVA